MITSFSVGRHWHCNREVPTKDKPNFDFVILGKGSTPRHVRCRLEVEGHDPNRNCWVAERHAKCCETCMHGLEQEYSKDHLKKVAVLVPAPSCWSCGKLTTNTNGVCDTCYRDPATNNCTECGKHLDGIRYEYVCGVCISAGFKAKGAADKK